MKKEWFDKILETGNKITINITLQDMYDELYEICDACHSSCDSECPVYDKCLTDGEFNPDKCNKCPYFKNGKKMFERLRK